MRVLHIYSGNLYGGVETVLVTLARYRHLCPTLEPRFALCFEGRLSDELAAAGVPAHLLGHVRLSRPWTVWKARHRLDEFLRNAPVDSVICHSCWPHALFAPVVRRRGLPLVFWAHDVPSGRSCLERLARRFKPDLVLANSQFTRSHVPRLFPGVSSRVVYLPVAGPDPADRRVVRSRMRALLHTPETAAVIIQVSRLERWKGHTLLLQALSRLRDTPEWVCWIAGGVQRPHEAAYLEELQATAARLQIAARVRFLGQRSDVPQLLAAADVHCQPNTGPEPFGAAFVEALYAGLPVVTTALGGGAEIVQDACGKLVPPDDPTALARALQPLLDDRPSCALLGAAGPARARQLCDPAAQMGLLYDLLVGLVRSKVAG